MTDTQENEPLNSAEQELAEELTPSVNAITAWRQERAARKARAAVTVKANAKEAQKAKSKALAKETTFDSTIAKRAKALEKQSTDRAKAKAEAEK